MTAPSPETLRALDGVLAQSPFLVAQGIRLVALDGEAACFELDPHPGQENSDGRMHGGLIATLLDAACGFPVRVVGGELRLVNAVTLSLTIDFLRPPAPGGPLRATGRIIGGGRSIVFSRGEVHDATGALVAAASGSFKRLHGRGPGQVSKGQAE